MENKNTLFGIYYDWWKNIDKFLFSLIVLLFLTGLFFSLVSTSLIASDKLDTNDYQFFFKHLVFILLGSPSKLEKTLLYCLTQWRSGREDDGVEAGPGRQQERPLAGLDSLDNSGHDGDQRSRLGGFQSPRLHWRTFFRLRSGHGQRQGGVFSSENFISFCFQSLRSLGEKIFGEFQ